MPNNDLTDEELRIQQRLEQEWAEKIKYFIRDNKSGGCRMLSLGDECDCELCCVDRLLATVRSQREEIKRLTGERECSLCYGTGEIPTVLGATCVAGEIQEVEGEPTPCDCKAVLNEKTRECERLRNESAERLHSFQGAERDCQEYEAEVEELREEIRALREALDEKTRECEELKVSREDERDRSNDKWVNGLGEVFETVDDVDPVALSAVVRGVVRASCARSPQTFEALDSLMARACRTKDLTTEVKALRETLEPLKKEYKRNVDQVDKGPTFILWSNLSPNATIVTQWTKAQIERVVSLLDRAARQGGDDA